MTHDELLERIIELDEFREYKDGLIKQSSALRAVVELHKPVQSYLFDEKDCFHCSSEEDRVEILYPCPTIQAIEKELA